MKIKMRDEDGDTVEVTGTDGRCMYFTVTQEGEPKSSGEYTKDEMIAFAEAILAAINPSRATEFLVDKKK